MRRIGHETKNKISLFLTALQVDCLPAEPAGKPKNTGVGSLSLLQRIFPTQEPNQGLLNCRRILYQLSYIIAKGSIHQKDTMVPNTDAPNYTASKFIKQNLIELKRET